MEIWNNIYSHFDRLAFEIFGLKIYWYGIMYVLALILALYMAKYLLKIDKYPFSENFIDRYFIWVEVGIIIGARLGFVLIYSGNQLFYILHPWEIFNPFYNGKFVGISGMSYHGAVVGFILATYLFYKKTKFNLLPLLDLVAICIPFGYIFGRIGNFLNQELFGRPTDVFWGIYVDGILRHPSQIYEAFLEGFVVFIFLFFYRNKKKFDGQLISLYIILYALMRFICEIFREPDFNLGFLIFGLSMGQILSFLMLIIGIIFYNSFKKFKKTI